MQPVGVKKISSIDYQWTPHLCRCPVPVDFPELGPLCHQDSRIRVFEGREGRVFHFYAREKTPRVIHRYRIESYDLGALST